MMASSAERLDVYRLYYHELSAAQSRIPPNKLNSREARLRQAELRKLEELIMLFADITPNPTSITSNDEATDHARPTADNPDMDSLDLSLVTDILLLSAPSPWILYIVVWSATEWRLCYISPSLKRLLGWRPSEVLGKPIWGGCIEEDVPILQQIFHPKGTSTIATASSSCASSNSWGAARSHAFGDFVTFRRVRRDQSIASMHGTGIAIGSRWFAWVEQDTSALKLALLGSSAADCMTSNSSLTDPEKVPVVDAKRSYKKGFQPPTIVEERALESEPAERNHRKGFQPPTIVGEGDVEKDVASKPVHRNHRMGTMGETKTQPMKEPSSPPSTARSKEITRSKVSVEYSSRHSSRHSSVESLPAHIDSSPRLLPQKPQKSNDVSDKVLDLMRGKTVLLVDDSNTYLKTGEALFAKMGCRVFIAHNGEEALQMLQHETPMADLPRQFDVVFMDLSMPKMDGIQAVKLFRNWEEDQQPGRAHTLIIAVTANDTDGDMVLCAQTGFDGFVTKPLNKQKILECRAASQQ